MAISGGFTTHADELFAWIIRNTGIIGHKLYFNVLTLYNLYIVMYLFATRKGLYIIQLWSLNKHSYIYLNSLEEAV